MTSFHKLCVAGLVGVLGIAATSALGFWQLRRAGAKEVLQRELEVAAAAPPVAVVWRDVQEPSKLVHRHLRLHGVWEPDRVVYLDNRPRTGQAGFYVLMPLRIDGPIATEVIVNRGWTPRNMNDRLAIGSYRTPEAPVDVVGVALSEEPRLLELAQPGDRRLKGIWQNFDLATYARLSGTNPLPIVVRQDGDDGVGDPTPASQPAPHGDGLARDWPDRGGTLQAQIDRHHGYAFQWFALAATLITLLVYQTIRVIRHDRTDPH